VIDQILDEADFASKADSLFLQAFELDQAYPLPDGDTVYLYRRRARPPEGVAADFFPDLAQTLSSMSQQSDALVFIPPSLIPLLGQHLDEDLRLAWRPDVYALPGGEPTEEALAAIAAGHDRVWAIFGEWGGDDLDAAGRRWLNEHSYRAWNAWFGPTQVVLYGIAPEPEPSSMHPVGADLGESVTLVGSSLQEGQAAAGEMFHLTLLWQARAGIDGDYKVFVHLVDGEGQLIAQRDSEPVGGSMPTTTWAVGEAITDRVGLLLPSDAPPGEYQLLVGMYDPATLERLSLLDGGDQAVGDSISLGTVRIVPTSP